jgi:hypothetical protein
MSRSNSGSKGFSWSQVKVKVVRKVFGVEPKPPSKSSSCLYSPWPFAYLEKCLCVSSAWDRDWKRDEDLEDDWAEAYQPKTRTWAETSSEDVQVSAAVAIEQGHASSGPRDINLSASSEPAPSVVSEDVTSVQLTLAETAKQARLDAQFGPIGSQEHRYVCEHMGGDLPEFIVDEPPQFYLITTYISYMILSCIGRIRDFFGKKFRPRRYKNMQAADGYAALNSDFENFYFRRMKMRMNDCFARPYVFALIAPTVVLFLATKY